MKGRSSPRRGARIDTELPLAPVMLVCGPERSLIERAVASVRRRVLDGAMVDFNHDRLSAKAASTEQILACARTIPVMAPRRLVEVADGEALGSEALEKIAAYAAQPSPDAVLLIVAQDVDRRTRGARAIEAAATFARFDHLTEQELPDYAVAAARAAGLALEPEAATVLCAATGTELQLVERAIEKLVLVSRDGSIGVADIEEHISQTRVESIFNLTDAIARNDAAEALRVLGQMLDAREAPLRILATLAWQQRQLVRARALLDQGTPPGQVLKTVKVFRHQDRFLRQVRALPTARVSAGLQALYQADRRLKSSRAPARAVMEQTVLQLAAGDR